MNLKTEFSSSDLFRGVAWSTALVASIVGILLGGVVLARDLPPLVAAIRSPSPDSSGPDGLSAATDRHAESAKVAKARFDKRSFFYDPPAPRKAAPAPKPLPPPPPPVDDTPPPPPPPPTTYGGPKPYGIMGDLVYFPTKGPIRLGEERDGIKVLAINGIWSVRLGWERGEYDFAWETAETKFLRNALGDEPDSKGILKPEGEDAVLNALAGSTPAGLAAPAQAKAAAKSINGSGVRGGRAAPTQEEVARAVEEGAAASGEESQAEPSGQGPAHRAPLSSDEIAALDRPAASKAFQEAVRAKSDMRLDEETRKAFQAEYDLILEHLKKLNSPGPGGAGGDKQ